MATIVVRPPTIASTRGIPGVSAIRVNPVRVVLPVVVGGRRVGGGVPDALATQGGGVLTPFAVLPSSQFITWRDTTQVLQFKLIGAGAATVLLTGDETITLIGEDAGGTEVINQAAVIEDRENGIVSVTTSVSVSSVGSRTLNRIVTDPFPQIREIFGHFNVEFLDGYFARVPTKGRILFSLYVPPEGP